MPWYELPAFYSAQRDELLRDNGGYVFPGYLRLAMTHAFRAKDSPMQLRGPVEKGK